MLIAFLDAGDAQHERAVGELRLRLAAGEPLLTSASVYAEVMVRPLQQGTAAMVDEFFNVTAIRVLAIDRGLARRAAQLRARHHSLRLGDALSLAAALENRVQLVTLDRRLRRVAAQEEQRDR